jgi:diguanylate cyclase (GGDEF)-like protein
LTLAPAPARPTACPPARSAERAAAAGAWLRAAGWLGGGAVSISRLGPLLAGLLAATALQAEPRSQAATAATELVAAVSTASPANVEVGALENRVQSIERLSKRDPQRALAELAALNRAGLSARGELRLAAANARIATTQYRMQDALALIDAALPRARALGDPAVLSLLLACRANALHEVNRGTEALAAGDEARTLADRTNDDELRVDARIFLVDYAARRGDFERAFAQLEDAEQIARRNGTPGLLAVVAYTGASLSNNIDDVAAAIAGYRLAEPAFREDGDPLAEADSARRLAGLLIGAERHTEALDLLQRALARYHALRDDYGIAAGTALMSRAMLGTGRADQAFVLSDEAIAALRTSDISDALAMALIDRVELKVATGRTSGTSALIDEARALLVRSDELHLRMRFQRVAATAYAALGRHREAHAALLELLRLRERYDDQRLSRQLAAQRGRLESQRMAADLERARREGEAHRTALAQAEKSARLQTALALLAGLALLAVLFALVRIMRRGQRNATLAQTDYLTGIQNRRRITELGQQLLAAARERGDPVSVLLLDLDHFKSINDDYGHQTGDRALKAVADELKRHLRSGDELGRYGGEEFAVVLPATSTERATAIAERLRTAIATLTFDALGLDQPLTVSVGVATAQAEREFGELVARADAALYSAKQAGRDRVAVAGEAPPAATPGGASGRAAVAPLPVTGRAALNTPFAQAE